MLRKRSLLVRILLFQLLNPTRNRLKLPWQCPADSGRRAVELPRERRVILPTLKGRHVYSAAQCYPSNHNQDTNRKISRFQNHLVLRDSYISNFRCGVCGLRNAGS